MATGDAIPESEMIQQFINITGAEETVAKNMLEAFNNNLEMAINMFLEGHNSNQQEVEEIPTENHSSGDSDRQKHKKPRTERESPVDQNGVMYVNLLKFTVCQNMKIKSYLFKGGNEK